MKVESGVDNIHIGGIFFCYGLRGQNYYNRGKNKLTCTQHHNTPFFDFFVDIVSYKCTAITSMGVPQNPIIFRVRHDMTWDAVIIPSQKHLRTKTVAGNYCC